jgi:DNA-binding NtrC family response regulator
VQRAYVMAPGDTIGDEWLPGAAPPPGELAAAAGANTASISIPLGTSMAEAERRLILGTLKHYGNHKERTAAALGVSLKTLYNRLKEYAADKVDGEG